MPVGGGDGCGVERMCCTASWRLVSEPAAAGSLWWWAQLWAGTLLSGWGENTDLQTVKFSLPSIASLLYFSDVKQMKRNNFFCNILLY